MNRNLVGSIYGRPSIKITHFVLIDRQFFFLVGRFLKLFSSENTWPNIAKFYRKYLLKVLYQISHFIPIGQKTWSPWAIVVSDWLKFKKSSETRRSHELLLCRNDVWEILYKIVIFRDDHTSNVVAIGSSCL